MKRLPVEVKRESSETLIWKSSMGSTDGKEPVRVVSHHFPPMNGKRRRFIHDLVEFYGMEAISFDPEPNCHVMVLAKRGALRLPGGALDHRGSLVNTLRRELSYDICPQAESAPKQSTGRLGKLKDLSKEEPEREEEEQRAQPTDPSTRVSYAEALAQK